MSPYKSDSIAINNEKLDRRVKLTQLQKKQIKNLHLKGVAIREITRLFGVSRRTIQYILFPERKIKQDWRKYYNKEKRREYMKRHRAYKNKLFKEGLIKQDPTKILPPIIPSSYYAGWFRTHGRKRNINYKEIIKKWQDEHPQEVKAQQQLREAVRTGKIIKPVLCEQCNKEKRLSGHHDDYSQPLKVKWLCGACHKIKHRTP